MSCFAQTSSGDLDLSTHNLVLVKDLDTCTAIKLTNRFKFFLGEWFLDTRQGIPYFQKIFVKAPDLRAIGQIFKRVIMTTPRCKALLQATLDFLSGQRSLTATFKVQTDSGAVIEGGVGTPFIVSNNGKN